MCSGFKLTNARFALTFAFFLVTIPFSNNAYLLFVVAIAFHCLLRYHATGVLR